jgi:hypothetical protein
VFNYYGYLLPDDKLTDDHMNPLDLAQDWTVLDNVLVRCEQHLKLTIAQLALQHPSLGRVAFVRNGLNLGCPFCELTRPIRQGG